MPIQRLIYDAKDLRANSKKSQMDLQRASEDRQRENLELQKTITDQNITIDILHKAMERLAQFYDAQLVRIKSDFMQTPPLMQGECIMSMIEQLIYDAKDLMANSKKSEMEAQEGYENQGVNELAKDVSTKKGLQLQFLFDLFEWQRLWDTLIQPRLEVGNI